jgi:hypothetical protein
MGARRGPAKQVKWAIVHSSEETGREMKATITLGVLLGLLAAWSGASGEVVRTPEPAWMLLSGASLLTVASLVRRYVP